MLIVGKADEKENGALSFINISVSRITNLGKTELFSFLTNWFWLLGTLCLLIGDLKKSPQEK